MIVVARCIYALVNVNISSSDYLRYVNFQSSESYQIRFLMEITYGNTRILPSFLNKVKCVEFMMGRLSITRIFSCTEISH